MEATVVRYVICKDKEFWCGLFPDGKELVGRFSPHLNDAMLMRSEREAHDTVNCRWFFNNSDILKRKEEMKDCCVKQITLKWNAS